MKSPFHKKYFREIIHDFDKMTQEINPVRLLSFKNVFSYRVTIFNYYICEKLAEFALTIFLIICNNIIIVVNGYGDNSLDKFTGGSPLCELVFFILLFSTCLL